MIQIIDKKPDNFFINLPDNYIWVELSAKKEKYGYAGIEIVKNQASLHIEFIAWSHSILKAMLKDWEQIKKICIRLGANQLIASNKNTHDHKWRKFIKLLGFSTIDTVLISTQEV